MAEPTTMQVTATIEKMQARHGRLFIRTMDAFLV
jgi:hypothetical protein